MPSFSRKSREALETCDTRLQHIFDEVIRYFDCTIVYGWRDQATQDELHRTGRSQLKWPDSKHNRTMQVEPDSFAVDAVPYPTGWSNREHMVYFAGQVIATARSLGYELRWGNDWDMDNRTDDNRFDDLAHFELVDD